MSHGDNNGYTMAEATRRAKEFWLDKFEAYKREVPGTRGWRAARMFAALAERTLAELPYDQTRRSGQDVRLRAWARYVRADHVYETTVREWEAARSRV